MRFLFFLLLLVPSFSSISFAKGNELKKSTWLEQFEINFTTSFCQKNKFVVDCLKMNEKICHTELKKLLSPCASQVQLKEQIQLGSESEIFGERLGRCLARGLYQKSQHPKGDSACSEKSLL